MKYRIIKYRNGVGETLYKVQQFLFDTWIPVKDSAKHYYKLEGAEGVLQRLKNKALRQEIYDMEVVKEEEF